MTEEDKKRMIKDHILKMEIDNNPFHDGKILISNIYFNNSKRQVKKPNSTIEISYLLKISSKLDSKWCLEKHKNLSLLGTFESIFLADIREETLKRIGI